MSRYVRAIPRTGYSAQIYQQADPNTPPRKVKPGLTRMKHEVWETLTPKGKEICAHLKMDEGEVLEPVDIDISEGLTAGGPGSNKVELGCAPANCGDALARPTQPCLFEVDLFILWMGSKTRRARRIGTRLRSCDHSQLTVDHSHS